MDTLPIRSVYLSHGIDYGYLNPTKFISKSWYRLWISYSYKVYIQVMVKTMDTLPLQSLYLSHDIVLHPLSI